MADPRDHVTTALDVLGLLAVAVGIGWAATSWWLPAGPVAGGLVLLGGVQLVHRGAELAAGVGRQRARLRAALQRRRVARATARAGRGGGS